MRVSGDMQVFRAHAMPCLLRQSPTIFPITLYALMHQGLHASQQSYLSMEKRFQSVLVPCHALLVCRPADR